MIKRSLDIFGVFAIVSQPMCQLTFIQVALKIYIYFYLHFPKQYFHLFTVCTNTKRRRIETCDYLMKNKDIHGTVTRHQLISECLFVTIASYLTAHKFLWYYKISLTFYSAFQVPECKHCYAHAYSYRKVFDLRCSFG